MPSPHSALLNVALEKLMGKPWLARSAGKLLSSPSTCVVPVLELQRRRDYFSSSRALEGSDDRHTESRTDGCTTTAVDGGRSEMHANPGLVIGDSCAGMHC